MQCCVLFSMFRLKWIYCLSFCMKITLLSSFCILLEKELYLIHEIAWKINMKSSVLLSCHLYSLIIRCTWMVFCFSHRCLYWKDAYTWTFLCAWNTSAYFLLDSQEKILQGLFKHAHLYIYIHIYRYIYLDNFQV